jgi:small redox-active disulfide protein 2
MLNNGLNMNNMEIKILGTGCPKCKTLEKFTREVVEQNGYNATITKVEDIMDIMKYSIMATPALVVNEKVEIKGRVPSADEIKQVLSKYK